MRNTNGPMKLPRSSTVGSVQGQALAGTRELTETVSDMNTGGTK